MKTQRSNIIIKQSLTLILHLRGLNTFQQRQSAFLFKSLPRPTRHIIDYRRSPRPAQACKLAALFRPDSLFFIVPDKTQNSLL